MASKADESKAPVLDFNALILSLGSSALVHLGEAPDPTGQKREQPDFTMAQQSIDLLAVLQEKTRGNLTSEEAAVLRNTLSNLQMVYVEVAQQAPKGAAQPERPAPEPKPEASTKMPEQPPIAPSTESESKKKFTKSYGS